jgi:threonine/homoserine/homoserine lactone efflux protein
MHPEFLSMALFWIVAAYTPGPNNVVASYSGFNFGIKKTIPLIFGVGLGYTLLVILVNYVLISTFQKFPIIQEIIRTLGTIFLFYLAYKIAFSPVSTESKKENPVKFLDTFLFQFVNPKGVMAAVTLISKFVLQEDYFRTSITVILVCAATAFLSITAWTFLGKFLRKFATNNSFIKRFNYAMSLLIVVCIVGFYI